MPIGVPCLVCGSRFRFLDAEGGFCSARCAAEGLGEPGPAPVPEPALRATSEELAPSTPAAGAVVRCPGSTVTAQHFIASGATLCVTCGWPYSRQ